MLVFVEGRKPENSDENPRSKARTYNKLNPHIAHRAGIEPRHRRGERFHRCAISAINTISLDLKTI